MNKRLRNIGLYLLMVITLILVGTSFIDRPGSSTGPRTLRYSDFIDAVQDNQVTRVLISPDNTTAQVVSDRRRFDVNLAPDKDLIKILSEHDKSAP